MPPPLRILLAEDDPVSRVFLQETLHGAGMDVTAVENGAAALDAARVDHFDLLLLDRNLPGVNGDRVLRALHADGRASSRGTTAVATTADPDPAVRDLLLATGFASVLIKPLDAATLLGALRGLGFAAAAAPALDEHAGVTACGSADALAAMRALFAQELDAFAVELDAMPRDPAAMTERLHRLRAACGFCGALPLRDAAQALGDALRGGDRASFAACFAAFGVCLATTRAALNIPRM